MEVKFEHLKESINGLGIIEGGVSCVNHTTPIKGKLQTTRYEMKHTGDKHLLIANLYGFLCRQMVNRGCSHMPKECPWSEIPDREAISEQEKAVNVI